MTTNNRMKESDLATSERKAAEAKIKKFDTDIQQAKSEIDKNIDVLNALEDHKNFLFKIFENENKKWVEDQQNQKKQKLAKRKKEWIEMAKIQKDMMDDDDAFIQELFGPLNAS